MSPLIEHMDHPQIVVLDLETTGLDHRCERIIEIGAVRMEGDTVIDSFSSLVKPDVPVRHSSFQVHHISDEMLEDAPSIEEVLPKLLEFIGDTPIVAHNAIFDYSFVNEACKRLYGERFKNIRIDTYEMFRVVFPEEISHGLSALLARFGFPSHVEHRALDDAQNLALVYPKLRELYVQQKSWQFSQLKNIEYLGEKYLRLQKAAQAIQAEMQDLKEIFKLHFQEGGHSIRLSNNEMLVGGYRRNYEYNDAKLREVIDASGLQAQAYKVNPRFIDKAIDRKLFDADIIEAFKDSRTKMSENRQVNFVKVHEPEAVSTDGEVVEEVDAASTPTETAAAE